MTYHPLTFAEFVNRLQGGRYLRLKAAKIAVTASSWEDDVKETAFRLCLDRFPREHSLFVPPRPRARMNAPSVALLKPVEEEETVEPIVHLQRLLRVRPDLHPYLLGALSLLGDHATARKPGVKKVRVIPVREPGEVAPVDIATMFDGPDAELEADPDEGPVTRAPAPTVVGSDPADVAKACAQRTDLERAIEEGDADPALDEKQKAALRVATRKLMELRDRKGGN